MVEFVFLFFKAKNEQEDEMKRSVLLMLAALIAGCSVNQEEREVKEFLQAQVAAIEPLEKETNLTYWNAAVTGSAEDYQRFGELNLQLRQIYADSAVFARIDQFRKSGAIKDKKLVRQLDLLYYAFLENQIEAPLLKQIVDRGAQVEQKFSTFRATLDGRTVTSNDIFRFSKTKPIHGFAGTPGWRANRSVEWLPRTSSNWSSCAIRLHKVWVLKIIIPWP
jgi:peptidyl-dipeptidase A